MKKILLPIIAIAIALNLTAQSDLKTKSISIFKNGQSFVIKKGNIKTNDKSYLMTDTPNALFGTLWFNSSNAKIAQITSKLDSVSTTSETQAISFAQLLYANIGKQVTVTTSYDKTYKGVVESFESPESPIAIIKTTTNWVSIAPSSIKNIEFDYKPATIAKLITKENKPVFDIQFDNNGTHDLEMMFLQDGLSWTPTYLLELVSETTAQIKLQAELTNNRESISNTDVNLVVGVPNFKYANQPATLLSFLAQIEPRYNNGSTSRLFSQQFSNAYGDDLMIAEPEMVKVDDQSTATGDFYFYSIKNLTLPKNGRGSYTLFENTINIKHIYECLLSANQKNSDNYNSSYSFEPVVSDVYHTIQIENKTKNPFTTGSVMIIDQKTQRPLVEDMLKYTAINQNSSIKLTTSPDIRVKEQENVIKTQEQEKKVNGYTYTLLTIESEVTITNSKNENVAMSLKRVLDGKIQNATIKYNSYQLPNTDRYNLNPIDNIAFDTEVKAGQSFKFTYTYLKYVRN